MHKSSPPRARATLIRERKKRRRATKIRGRQLREHIDYSGNTMDAKRAQKREGRTKGEREFAADLIRRINN